MKKYKSIYNEHSDKEIRQEFSYATENSDAKLSKKDIKRIKELLNKNNNILSDALDDFLEEQE